MKIITLKLDLYSKIVLTIIALSLGGLLLQGWGVGHQLKAQEMSININNPEDIASAIANQTLNVSVVNTFDIGRDVALWMNANK